MEGGDLKKINLNKNSVNNKTFELFIDPFDINGNLIVQIPRSIIDSKTPANQDNRFEVLVDDKPSKFSEITHTNDSDNATALDNETINSFFNDIHNRELSIEFGKDAKVIEISGRICLRIKITLTRKTNWFSIIIPVVF